MSSLDTDILLYENRAVLRFCLFVCFMAFAFKDSCMLPASPVWTFGGPYGLYLTRLHCLHFPGKNNGVACCFFLQGIFLETEDQDQSLNTAGGLFPYLSHQGRLLKFNWLERNKIQTTLILTSTQYVNNQLGITAHIYNC